MPKEKILLVCDRGALDNKAYMTQADFDKVLDIVGHNEVELRDSYEAVFHLVTCAKGAEEFYTLENNGARTETVEQATALDDKIIAAWTGHPHLRIIDNDTDFELKMKRLLDEMTAFLGEEAPRDIKRRFLIDYPDIMHLESLPNCQRLEISQTYLVAPEGEENRVRQRGVDGNYIYFQTKKRNVAENQRIRLERRLSKDEYIRLLMDADPSCRPIRKTRYCLTYMNQYFEIDVYPFWNDKAIIEIEQGEEDTNIIFPDFVNVVREVTDDEAYKNLTLAKI
jgi:CYTH domain-containing protein